MNAIIIDDENNAIVTLRNDLQTYCPEINVSAWFTKAADALAYVSSGMPDIIFLDIDMPVMNGFDFIEALDKSVSAQIIFVSAYSEFAIRAFKVNALDYLLKPFAPPELSLAVQRALAKKTSRTDQTISLKNLIDNYTMEGPKERIVLPVSDGYQLIDPVHIIYCRAEGAYTAIIMDNDKNLLVSRTLGRIQELMPRAYFERIHQSYLVNLEHVKKFRMGESPVAIMSDHTVLKVSRLKKERLAQRLGIK